MNKDCVQFLLQLPGLISLLNSEPPQSKKRKCRVFQSSKKTPFRTAGLSFIFWNEFCDGEEESLAPNAVLPQNCLNQFCFSGTVSLLSWKLNPRSGKSHHFLILDFSFIITRRSPDTPQ